MNKEDKMDPEEVARLLAESYGALSKYAHDIAYARMTMYSAYLSEGFTPGEALELCKIL